MASIVSRFFVCFFLLFSVCLNLTQSDSFASFNKFRGSKKGDHVEGLYRVKKYFNQFGYLDTIDASKKDVIDDALESAVKTYQLNYNLEITGILDSHTVSFMMMPRCGVPDIIDGNNGMYSGTNDLNTSQFAIMVR